MTLAYIFVMYLLVGHVALSLGVKISFKYRREILSGGILTN